jgi:hypothetical protein
VKGVSSVPKLTSLGRKPNKAAKLNGKHPDLLRFGQALDAQARGEGAEADQQAVAAIYPNFGHLLSRSAIGEATGALITGDDRARILSRA